MKHLFLSSVLIAASCSGEPDLRIYCSLDQVHAEPIVALFEERTGLEVKADFDVERNKTVGLVNRIIAENQRGTSLADVFWNNETAQTIRLQKLGLTTPHRSLATSGIPSQFKDPNHHWVGFAARARVILHRNDVPNIQIPRTWEELHKEPFASRGAMAAPLTGTTLTHFAVLSHRLGKERILRWLETAIESNLIIGGGNADVMRRVCEGDIDWCLTDTDDAAAARLNGYPVDISFLDQDRGEIGTLLIPNTACILKGARNPNSAALFLDFLISEEIEGLLASSRSEQIPLRPGVVPPPGLAIPSRDFSVMEVNWGKTAEQISLLFPEFKEIFLR